MRSTRNPGRPLRELRFLGHDPQALQALPGEALRRALFRRGARPDRLLITLSDGKPDDYDGYRGDYGVEDTRQAPIKAKRAGIHPFCITIDTEARDYLPHMYGAVNWALVDDVRKLPMRVSDIYRRLTL